MKLLITSSPHMFNARNTSGIMYRVLLALLPAVAASIYFQGLNSAYIFAACAAGAVLSEFVLQKMMKKAVTVNDGSALITGLLLALIIPAGAPLWMAFLAGVFAISAGKQAFGGLGRNIFNPALSGRVFFTILVWVYAFVQSGTSPADAVSASPYAASEVPAAELYSKIPVFLSNIGTSFSETMVIAVIIGWLILYLTKAFDWRIPAGFLITVLLLSTVTWKHDPLDFSDPLYYLFSFNLLLGAVFMASDCVTSPVTRKGRWIFSIGCGIILMLLRLKINLNESVAYSILAMNGLTPLIDRIIRPKVFGHA